MKTYADANLLVRIYLQLPEREAALEELTAADTRSGLRPSFSAAADPSMARTLFDFLVAKAGELHPDVASGRFGADMQVSLVNDGPVTFWLQVR